MKIVWISCLIIGHWYTKIGAQSTYVSLAPLAAAAEEGEKKQRAGIKAVVGLALASAVCCTIPALAQDAAIPTEQDPMNQEQVIIIDESPDSLTQGKSLNGNPLDASSQANGVAVGRIPLHPIHIRNTRNHNRVNFLGFSPELLKKAYGLDKFEVNGLPADGANQVITIIALLGSPTLQQDLDAFSSRYNIKSTNIEFFYPDGQPPSYNGSDSARGAAFEATLDVEWAHAMAPAARIQVIVAKSLSLSSLMSAVKFATGNGSKLISMSWGAPEFSTERSYDWYFDPSVATFLAASGDDTGVVYWPASSPGVTGVGGTTLKISSTRGGGISEVGWSSGGGGVSQYEPKPLFQQQLNPGLNRQVPDVSLNADPVTGYPIAYSFDGIMNWGMLGGTSASAPIWAGIIALVNSARANAIVNLNPMLYNLKLNKNVPILRDIIRGCIGENSQICAGAGYDDVTGLGTPEWYGIYG